MAKPIIENHNQLQEVLKSFKGTISSSRKNNHIALLTDTVTQLFDVQEKYNTLLKNVAFRDRYHAKMNKKLDEIRNRNSASILNFITRVIDEIHLSIEELKKAIENMKDGVFQISESATSLSESVNNQQRVWETTIQSIDNVNGKYAYIREGLITLDTIMNTLNTNSANLNDQVTTMKQVGDNLSLLSLNGQIEAARSSGSHGRGFAVVAEEISKLSENVTGISKEQNTKISQIINNILSAYENSKKIKITQEENIGNMENIAGAMQLFNSELHTIAASAEQLSASGEEFSATIEQIFAGIDSIERNIDGFKQAVKQRIDLYSEINSIPEVFENLASDSHSMQEAAQKIVQWLFQNLKSPETGKNYVVLDRIFVTMPFKDMPRFYQEKYIKEGDTPESMFLCLIGTAGVRPEWNDIGKSKTRQAIRLPQKKEDLKIMPMLNKMFGQAMGIPYEDVIHPLEGKERPTVEGRQLEEDALASEAIPAKDFIQENGIISEIGQGAVLVHGQVLARFSFTMIPLNKEYADMYDIIPIAIQNALNSFAQSKNYWNREYFERKGPAE